MTPADPGSAAAAPASGRGGFGLIWAGQAVSSIGTAVTTLALPILALRELHAAAWQVGLLTACVYATYSVVVLPAGTWLDRHSRRPAVVLGDLGRGLVLAGIPLAHTLGCLTYGQLVLTALLTGTLSATFDVAYQSWLPSLIPAANLVRANGLLGATDAAGRLAGPGIAGALIAAVSAATTIGLDAGSFLIAAASTLLVRARAPVKPATAPRGLTAARQGIAWIRRTWLLRASILAGSWANFFVALWLAAETVFLIDQLHASSTHTGLVLAIGSSGGVIGGLIAFRIASRLEVRTALLLMGAIGGPFALLAPLGTPLLGPWSVSIGLFGVTATNAISTASAVAYRQSTIPDHLLARVTAAARLCTYTVLPLGALAGAVLLVITSPRTVLIIAALGYGTQWIYLTRPPTDHRVY